MQRNNISILCTVPLLQTQMDDAKRAGIDIDVVSFIETSIIQSAAIKEKIRQALVQNIAVVFTSMNAVESVAMELKQQPSWGIYCIGNATQQLVKKYFGEKMIVGTAPDATRLAEAIVDKKQHDKVVFFCGDRRRDELPNLLRKNNIDVEEIVVYRTIATAKKIDKTYNGILFFSPSAVESFFSINQPNDQTVLFAIGNTTAETIKNYCNNKIVVSDEPAKEMLLQKVLKVVNGE